MSDFLILLDLHPYGLQQKLVQFFSVVIAVDKAHLN